jgi:hypothetical protein
MYATTLRFLCMPLQYWRTILLVVLIGFLASTITRDLLATVLTTTASSFAFRHYENRHWISIPTQAGIGDVAIRLLFASATALII